MNRNFVRHCQSGYDITMKKLTVFLVCAGLAFPAFPAGLPDLGDNSEAAFNSTQDRALGQKIMHDIRADRDYVDDPELSEYLNALGGRLVLSAQSVRDQFEFFFVRDNSINAFALPGGYVGVHSGLILAAQSESELASVLAHEITHVTQRHIARQIAGTENTNLITSVAMLAALIIAARTNSQVGQAAVATSQGLAIQNQLDYTREHEREADRIGLQVLEKSGFDPHAMANFFDRLQKSTRFQESNAPSYLRTHPLNSERIADVQNRVQKTAPKIIADSLDYQLVRAKLRAQDGAAREAVNFFDATAANKTTANFYDATTANKTAAQSYGAAIALLRLREFDRAEKEITAARKFASHPMLDNLAAQIKRESGDNSSALEILRAGIKSAPQSRALNYAYIETLLAAKQNDLALKNVNERLTSVQDDYRLYELQAKSYAALGKKLPQHQAQAEAYIRQEKLQAALEQLQLAVKSTDGDDYQVSAAEARMRQIKQQVADEEKENKRTKRQ
jgi:beta-barrel assembly-enhancing protease